MFLSGLPAPKGNRRDFWFAGCRFYVYLYGLCGEGLLCADAVVFVLDIIWLLAHFNSYLCE